MSHQTPVTSLSFSSLHLPEALARGIADAGFERCTPIQAQTLPRALAGLDVAGQAQTGTGKTAAFLVAIYAALLRHPAGPDRPITSPRAFILAPTRELAVQIHKDAELLGQYTGLTLGLAFGGIDYEKQRRHLEAGVDILIGTPGRIIDFFKQRVFDLRHVRVMVLDEADRMFDLGFIADIRYLMRRLPPPTERLSMLFSATLAQRVLELAYEHMNEPELIRIEPEKVTADLVRQSIYFPSMEEKAGLLVGLLKKLGATRTMVFVNMKRTAERLEAVLRANGIDAQAMSGDVPQTKRLRMLRDFHEGRLPVLIATDVAARGLHIPDVSHVFNYDLPQDPEDYVHRIGRTARAGAAGDAISFGCEDYVVSLPDIEAFIGAKLPVEPVEPELVVPLERPEYTPLMGRDRGGPRRSGGRGAREHGRDGRAREGGDHRPRPLGPLPAGMAAVSAPALVAVRPTTGTPRRPAPQRPAEGRGEPRRDGRRPPAPPVTGGVPASPVVEDAAKVPVRKRRRRRRGRGSAARRAEPEMAVAASAPPALVKAPAGAQFKLIALALLAVLAVAAVALWFARS